MRMSMLETYSNKDGHVAHSVTGSSIDVTDHVSCALRSSSGI